MTEQGAVVLSAAKAVHPPITDTERNAGSFRDAMPRFAALQGAAGCYSLRTCITTPGLA